MKIYKKIWILIILSIVIGIVLMAIGYVSGSKGTYIDIAGVHIYDDTKQIIEEKKLEEITKIDINVDWYNISIEEGKDYGLEIVCYGEKNQIDWKLKDGKLTINEEKYETKVRIFNIGRLNWNKKPEIKIYLPKEAVLNHVILNVESGKIEISDKVIEDLKINNEFGNVVINNLESNKVDIEINSGNFLGKNIISNEMNIETDFGNVTIENGKNDKMYLKLESGNVKLTNIETENLKVETDFGKMITENIKVVNSNIATNSGNIVLDGDINGNTIINSEFGNITINTRKEEKYYTLDIDTNFGKIVINKEKLKKSDIYITNEISNQLMKITADSGNINLNFDK